MEARKQAWRPEDVAVAGVVLTLTPDGTVRAERGFVRPEDEPTRPEPVAPAADGNGNGQDGAGESGEDMDSDSGDAPAGGGAGAGGAWPLPEDKAPALSAVLQGELEAHRTAGLQAELARQPELALRVMLHALATDAFYARYADTVARFTSYPPNLAASCPGIADSPARQAMTQAEADWRGRLPEREADLWTWLQEQDTAALLGLLAVCVARTAEAGRADWTTPQGAGTIHAKVAQAAGLDMRRWWTVTPEGYFARVPKAMILAAVRDDVGGNAAHRLRDVKKEVMVQDAAALLDGKGWLPRVLRVPGVVAAAEADTSAPEAVGEVAGAPKGANEEAGAPALAQEAAE